MKSKIENYLTIEQARELFEIKGSDVVWRTVRNPRLKVGSIAGYKKTNKANEYRQINILCADKKIHMVPAHQIAFALHHGRWAALEIDHKDMNGLNNDPFNLREATPSQNGSNTLARSNTGVKGVTFSSDPQKLKPYQVQLYAKGTKVFHDYFATLEEATVVVRAERIKHHGEFANHG